MLFRLLFYLPADARFARHGTSIYVPKEPGFVCPGGPHHEFEKFERMATMPFLPNSADVRVGDLLVSSGLGDAFPAGYPVARISRVDRRPGEPFARVEATPTAALNRARQVLLVWEGGEAELPMPGEDWSTEEAAGPLTGDDEPGGDAERPAPEGDWPADATMPLSLGAAADGDRP